MIVIVYQGLVDVLIEHHTNIGDIISNRYLKVMFKIPKMGNLPNPLVDGQNHGVFL
jgi:hypothetical protein